MTFKKRLGNNPLNKYFDDKGNYVYELSSEGKKTMNTLLSAVKGKDVRELETCGNFLRKVSLNPKYFDDKGNCVYELASEAKKEMNELFPVIKGKDVRELEACGNFLREVSLNPEYLNNQQMLEKLMMHAIAFALKSQWDRERMLEEREY